MITCWCLAIVTKDIFSPSVPSMGLESGIFVSSCDLPIRLNIPWEKLGHNAHILFDTTKGEKLIPRYHYTSLRGIKRAYHRKVSFITASRSGISFKTSTMLKDAGTWASAISFRRCHWISGWSARFWNMRHRVPEVVSAEANMTRLAGKRF